MELTQLTFIVLFYLGFGTLLSFGLLRPKETGARFYTIHGWGALSIVLGSYFLLKYSFPSNETVFWYACFLVFSFLYCLTAGRAKHIYLPLFFLAILGGSYVVLQDLSTLVAPALYPRALLNSFLSAAFLGFTMTAMMLGHWYLNQPKMSGDELKRITVAWLILVGARFLLSTFQIIQIFSPMTEAQIYHELLGTTPGIFLTMRYFWGVLGPLGLAYFIWGTVKIRSTQSATGILYVAVVFVLIGEIISQYLTFFHGLPI